MPDIFARMIQIAGAPLDWQGGTTILRLGELGLEIGPETKLMVGDGVSTHDQLKYIQFGTGGLDPNVAAALNAKADKVTTVHPGPGLIGGGQLTGDITLTIDSGSNGYGRRYVETTTPTAGVGSDGDIWYQV